MIVWFLLEVSCIADYLVLWLLPRTRCLDLRFLSCGGNLFMVVLSFVGCYCVEWLSCDLML